MTQSLRLVYLFDGVPLGFSADLAQNLGESGHKILVAVKTPEGKIENEFVRLVRKTGCDGFAITPSERSEKGIADMLDAGLGRYGRISRVVFIRQIKGDSEDLIASEISVKTLPAITQLVTSYKSYLKSRFPDLLYDLILHIPAPFIDSAQVLQATKSDSTGLSNCFISIAPAKKNPFLPADLDSDLEEITRLKNLITAFP